MRRRSRERARGPAPVHQPDLWSGTPLERGAVAEDLPPISDWPPPEIKARWAAVRERQRRRKEVRRKAFLGIVAAVVLVAGVVALTRIGGGGGAKPNAAAGARPQVLAWSVDLGLQPVVTVVAVPGDRPPAIVAIPGGTQVDIPGGPSTVDAASTSSGLMVAAVQAALDRRVDHFLFSDAGSLMTLVDRLGGLNVESEASFFFQGRTLGPGRVHLTGGAVLAYLQSAPPEDLTGRWEEILSGIFAAKSPAEPLSELAGETDELAPVRAILAAARGGVVLELPTAPTPEGTIQIDPKGVAQLLQTNFGPAGRQLIRVVLLNGTGRRDVGAELSSILAPAGFQVVAAQEAAVRIVRSTEVVASGDEFLGQAQRVQSLLGVGMVYVGPQPTGIADITIVVGRDFKPA